jgi:hypothetical protein
MMSDILTRLSAVPSRPHGATETTDETYDRQLRDLVTYLKQPGLVPSTTDPNEYLQVSILRQLKRVIASVKVHIDDCNHATGTQPIDTQFVLPLPPAVSYTTGPEKNEARHTRCTSTGRNPVEMGR